MPQAERSCERAPANWDKKELHMRYLTSSPLMVTQEPLNRSPKSLEQDKSLPPPCPQSLLNRGSELSRSTHAAQPFFSASLLPTGQEGPRLWFGPGGFPMHRQRATQLGKGVRGLFGTGCRLFFQRQLQRLWRGLQTTEPSRGEGRR